MSGRGRGRGGPSNPLRDASWYDPVAANEARQDNRPLPTYPSRDRLPVPDIPTALERAQVAAQQQLIKRFRTGPLYTHPTRAASMAPGAGPVKTFDEDQVNAQYASRHDKALFDPFTGMQMWSERFVTKKRYLPEIKGAAWNAKYLPVELHCVLPNHQPSTTTKSKQTLTAAQRAARIQDHLKATDAMQDGQDGALGDDDEREANDEDGPERDPDENSENMDDDFEDAEDDMGGDYNAENYFDNGEGDDDDDDAGGDDY